MRTKRKKMKLERRPLHVPAHALTWKEDEEILKEQALAGLRRLAGRGGIENYFDPHLDLGPLNP